MRRLTITAVIILISCAFMRAENDVLLRLQPNTYDPSSNSVFIDIEIKYDGQGEFVLADQNYRIYFDASSLAFDPENSNSDLPRDLYSNIDLHELITDAHADEVNQLPFDKHLGFLNFSINLVNDLKGGVRIKKSHGWERIAVLKFKLAPNQDPADIVWSREGMTNEYATAFVQILEWISPNKTSLANVLEYTDTSVADSRSPKISTITLAPNPAIDFVNVTLDEQATSQVNINVTDATGKEVIKEQLVRGDKTLMITTSGFPAGTYNIEVHDTGTGNKFVETFIKVKS